MPRILSYWLTLQLFVIPVSLKLRNQFFVDDANSYFSFFWMKPQASPLLLPSTHPSQGRRARTCPERQSLCRRSRCCGRSITALGARMPRMLAGQPWTRRGERGIAMLCVDACPVTSNLLLSLL